MCLICPWSIRGVQRLRLLMIPVIVVILFVVSAIIFGVQYALDSSSSLFTEILLVAFLCIFVLLLFMFMVCIRRAVIRFGIFIQGEQNRLLG
jgi:hypothetical protein